MPKVWLLKVRFVPPLEKRLKNPFLDDDPFDQLGAEKTKFSATKPHFQPIYPRNFKQMNILSSEAHGTEKCDEF